MSAIRAIVRNGRLETDEPINLPDGTEFTIELPDSADVEPGWDVSPEGIAAWIERDKADVPPIFEAAKFDEAMAWLKESDRLALEKLNRKADGMFPRGVVHESRWNRGGPAFVGRVEVAQRPKPDARVEVFPWVSGFARLAARSTRPTFSPNRFCSPTKVIQTRSHETLSSRHQRMCRILIRRRKK